MKKSIIVIAVILLVLIVDQWLKFYVKLNIEYLQEFGIFGLSWARIKFIENNGMAFGMELGGTTGKLILSVFRLLMVSFLVYMIIQMVRANEKTGLLISFSLIIAGAFGNIVDSAFYGMIFSASSYHGGLAEFMPEGGGYGRFLHGKVVDMLYFPLIKTNYPDWFPFGLAGKRFEFFRPIFNIADSAISIGVVSILLFYSSYFLSDKKKEEPASVPEIKPENPDTPS